MFNVWQNSACKSLKWILLLIVVASVAGCASPSKKACLQKDWQRVGYEEGNQGRMATHSAPQRDTCTREGVPPDMVQYERGRRRGLEKYCTADNGHRLGAKGDPYYGVCQPGLKGQFMEAYQKGLRIYAQQLEGDIKAMVRQQEKLRQKLTGVEEDIAFLEKEIAGASEGQARLRMGMISEMEMLEADQQSLTLQISALGMDLNQMRQRLSQIRLPDGSLNQ